MKYDTFTREKLPRPQAFSARHAAFSSVNLRSGHGMRGWMQDGPGSG
jgi:hypothetical protein